MGKGPETGCAYPTSRVLMAVHPSMITRAPEVVEFLRKWEFKADSQVAAEGWMAENKAAVDEAAIWFLKNDDVWTGWVPEDVKSKVQEALVAEEPQSVTATNGLQTEDVVVGSGQPARAGTTLVVHYTGWLVDGTKFDSSLDRGTPFVFVLGQGRVIKGWDEGLDSMRVGGKRKLTIPPELGYGDRGAGGVIPPGATLVFEVELLEVR